MPACVYGRVLKHRGDVGHLRHSYTFIWTAAFILEGAVMENTGSLALAAWLGSDLWQLKLQVLTSRARALSHLLHRSRVVPTPSCSNQRDLCSEQNITVQPDISLQNHFLFNVETREQRRGDGRLRRFICLTEQRREKGEQCLSVPHLHGCVCVWGGVPCRAAAGSGAPCAPAWRWWWSRHLVAHPRLCCTGTEGDTAKTQQRLISFQILHKQEAELDSSGKLIISEFVKYWNLYQCWKWQLRLHQQKQHLSLCAVIELLLISDS